MPAETEVIDVPDEPVTTVIPQDKLPQSPATSPDDDHVALPPDPGFQLNSMQDKLNKLMGEVLAKPEAKTVEPAIKPDAKPADKPADKQADKPATDANKPAEPDPPENFTSAKAADWKRLKDAIAQRDAKLNEIEKKVLLKEKELAEAQNKFKAEDRSPIYTKQIEELKAERDKLTEKLEAVALEKSERFSGHFQKTFDSAIARAKDAAGKDNSERVEQLLNLPPSQWRKERLNEIRQSLTGVDQGQLDVAIADMDRARSEKDMALSKSRENYQRLQDVQKQEAAQNQQLIAARTEAMVQRVLSMAKQYEAFQEKENDPEHNLQVKLNGERIASFFKMQLPAEEIATMPIAAAEGKRLLEKVVPALQAEIAQLKQALEDKKTAIPNAAGGTKGSNATQAKPKSFTEHFREHWPGTE
jgi:hypothetical protein